MFNSKIKVKIIQLNLVFTRKSTCLDSSHYIFFIEYTESNKSVNCYSKNLKKLQIIVI